MRGDLPPERGFSPQPPANRLPQKVGFTGKHPGRDIQGCLPDEQYDELIRLPDERRTKATVTIQGRSVNFMVHASTCGACKTRYEYRRDVVLGQ